MAGLRVVRGPDWKWESQDGGEGYVGTTTGNKASDKWANILWDSGRKNDYRAGANDSSDLLVLDNGPAGVTHPGVMCDACKENNIRGLRWKCADCPDYDLCTECYGNDKHDRNHRFKRRDTHNSDMVNVGKRQNAVKLQSRGIYAGAIVVRGEDWDKDNQDGGVGSVGTVTKIGYVEENGQHKAAVVVKWARDSSTGYIYRRGLGGNVDVKFKTPAIGWSYYRDHLPHLRDAQKIATRTPVTRQSSGEDGADILAQLFTASLQMLAEGLGNDIGKVKHAKRAETMGKFNVGDLVRLHHDIDTVRQLQEGHGSFNILMIPALGKTGVVKEIDGDGDVKVRFGGVEWVVNPATLTKVRVPATATVRPASVETIPSNSASPFRSGDRIIINKNVEKVKELQTGHGGWTDSLKPFVGTGVVGIVRGVDSDNDLKVAFGDQSFLLNPDVCSEAPKVPKPVKKQNEAANNPSEGYKVGDRVTIDRDIDFVKREQVGHGGWHENMKKDAKSSGIVKEIDSDGDLKVEFEDNTWTLNPEVCHKVKVEEEAKPKRKDKNVNKVENVLQATKGKELKVGDRVRLDSSVDFIKQMQDGHGGWNDDMQQVMQKVGVVESIDADGDVKVNFETATWVLNPAVCHKEDPAARPKKKDINAQTSVDEKKFKVGDEVRTIGDVEKIKALQSGHGGWNDAMKYAIPVTGHVLELDGDGDVKVDFGGTSWTLNPEVLRKYEKPAAVGAKSKDTNATKNVNAQRKEESPCAGASGGLPSTSGAGHFNFTVGEQVKLTVKTEELKFMQKGHGGWNDGMIKAIGEIGVVQAVDTDGDLIVKFVEGSYSLNPKAVVSLDAQKNKPEKAPGAIEIQGDNWTEFKPGDCVKIVLDADIVMTLQQGHGGWNGAMTMAIGKVGVVHDVLASGDVNVKYGDNCWTFNPAVFMLVNAGEGQKPLHAPTRANRNTESNTAKYQCPICMDRGISVVFNCGHGTCDVCSKSIEQCHICRNPIALRTKMFL